jgi:hypothetical protein
VGWCLVGYLKRQIETDENNCKSFSSPSCTPVTAPPKSSQLQSQHKNCECRDCSQTGIEKIPIQCTMQHIRLFLKWTLRFKFQMYYNSGPVGILFRVSALLLEIFIVWLVDSFWFYIIMVKFVVGSFAESGLKHKL